LSLVFRFPYLNIPDREILIGEESILTVYFPSGKYSMDETQTLTPSKLGDLVKEVRKASHLRQDQLAGVAGVGIRFIVDLEAGKPTAQIGKVLAVLAVLGVTLTVTPPPNLDLSRTPQSRR